MSYGGGTGGCLTSARFTMKATILRKSSEFQPAVTDPAFGEWVKSQDPVTKEIVNVWTPVKKPGNVAGQPESFVEVNCIARGIVDGGIRVAGTTERFGENYENVDFVKLWVASNVLITKRDRITNIKDATGKIRWRDEEYEEVDPNVVIDLGNDATFNPVQRATVFNVNGVTPLFNAFNQIVEQSILLERTE